MKVKSLSCVRLSVTLWIAAFQAPPSMGFSRQEYWSGVPLPSPPYPSKALYFLLPLPPTPLSTGCYQNLCNPGSCTTSTPGPHRGKHKSSRAASGANPSGRPTCQGGNKTTIETQGSVTKEEGPKPSHHLYKQQIKSTQSTRQTVTMEYDKGH